MSRGVGAIVPAGWAAYNAAWLCTLAAMGGRAPELWLYGGAIALTELFAGAMVVSGRRTGAMRRYQLSVRGEASIFGAAGCALAGLAVVFGAWFYPMAAVMIVWAVVLAGWDMADRHRVSH